MTCRTLYKNTENINKQNTQIIVHYPPWESYTTKQSKRGVIIGTIHRINMQNSTITLAAQSMFENYREYRSIKYKTKFYIATLRRFLRNETPETKELADIVRHTIELIHTYKQKRRQEKKTINNR